MSSDLILNKIPLEEISVGMQASYSQIVTDSDIKNFSQISGDINPVHLDEGYAKNSKFKKRIAHGMMTASYFSALFGTKIPGVGCVYTSQALSFKRPVYIGDKVTANVTVTNVDADKRRVKFKTICLVRNKIVTSGEAEIYVPLEFKKIIINKKEDLLNYKRQIFKLYKNSFNEFIDEELWHWAYINNPNGNPLVSLYFDKDKLVGHYAVIPMTFLYKEKPLNAVLSMTTMVEASYRKYGIFIEQANEIYEKAEKLGYKFVCGFPNKKSAPGFKKRLSWTLEEDLYVAKFSYNELQKIKKKSNSNLISFNTQDNKNIEWRLNKPNRKYIKNNKNIFKIYDKDLDLVFNSYEFSMLDKNKKFNLLMEHELDKHLEKKQFDYIFGYKIFDSSLRGIKFKKDLIISDVF